MSQTEDQYLFATVCDQELTFYVFRQVSMSNPYWYKHFNTNFNVSESVGVTRQYKALLEYMTQEAHSLDYYSFMGEQQEAVHIDAKARYLSYAVLIQSGFQHIKLKVDLQNDFTTVNYIYPKYRPQTLHLLGK